MKSILENIALMFVVCFILFFYRVRVIIEQLVSPIEKSVVQMMNNILQQNVLSFVFLVLKTLSMVASDEALSQLGPLGVVFLPVSSQQDGCSQRCALTVNEGVMFQRWVAFPVFIDCCEAALDDTAFRYISGGGRLDRLSDENSGLREVRADVKTQLVVGHRCIDRSPSALRAPSCVFIGLSLEKSKQQRRGERMLIATHLMCSDPLRARWTRIAKTASGSHQIQVMEK